MDLSTIHIKERLPHLEWSLSGLDAIILGETYNLFYVIISTPTQIFLLDTWCLLSCPMGKTLCYSYTIWQHAWQGFQQCHNFLQTERNCIIFLTGTPKVWILTDLQGVQIFGVDLKSTLKKVSHFEDISPSCLKLCPCLSAWLQNRDTSNGISFIF